MFEFLFDKKHDVSEIVASFSETIAKLRAAAEYHMDQSSICYTETEALRDTADDHNSDRIRASAIADKITDLIDA